MPRSLPPLSLTTTPPSGAVVPMATCDPVPEKAQITRAVAGIGLYAGAFGVTFGAVAAAAGLSAVQAVAMSAVMFTGASQFALVGVLAAGGAPLAGLSAALLLGLRNAFYGVPGARPRPNRRGDVGLERPE